MNQQSDLPLFVPIFFASAMAIGAATPFLIEFVPWGWYRLPRALRRRIKLVAARCRLIERRYGWISRKWFGNFRFNGRRIVCNYQWNESLAVEFLSDAESFLQSQINQCEQHQRDEMTAIQQLADFDKKFLHTTGESVSALPDGVTYSIRPQRRSVLIPIMLLAAFAVTAWYAATMVIIPSIIEKQTNSDGETVWVEKKDGAK